MNAHQPTTPPRARPVRRGARSGRAALAAGGLVLGLVLTATACGGGRSLENEKSGGAPSGSSAGTMTIGSASFTESQLLAQAYALLLRKAGYSTRVTTVANRELYEPALEKGTLDVVPEYAATLAEFLNTREHGANAGPVASPDLGRTLRALNALAAPRGLRTLKPARAVDQNAFAVNRDFAARHHLKTLSDLGRANLKVRLAAGDECARRPFCQPGLERTYGIRVARLDALGVGTPQAKQAVQNGQDDLVLTTTTDATLDQYHLVLLRDDRKLQNADYVLPVVNARRAGGAKVAAALDPLADVLTTADLTRLDRQVDGERRKPSEVARAYLTEKGLL